MHLPPEKVKLESGASSEVAKLMASKKTTTKTKNKRNPVLSAVPVSE